MIKIFFNKNLFKKTILTMGIPFKDKAKTDIKLEFALCKGKKLFRAICGNLIIL